MPGVGETGIQSPAGQTGYRSAMLDDTPRAFDAGRQGLRFDRSFMTMELPRTGRGRWQTVSGQIVGTSGPPG
ncbi:MAG: hypothetical protein ACR2OU_01835, partial [Thermomicrobiales bacterium]